MATFEGSSKNEESVMDIKKYPIKRVEPSIRKFTEVVEINLDRMTRHKLNIEKFQHMQDWHNLDKEQIKATTTVKQIQASIKEIEKARKQTCDEDLAKFDEKVAVMKQKAIFGIGEFLHVKIEEYEDESPADVMSSSSISSSFGQRRSYSEDDIVSQNASPYSLQQVLQEKPLVIIPDDSEAAASWESLQQSLIDLNSVIQDFASIVQEQQEPLDRITDNIDTAQVEVSSGVGHLGKASKYKAAIIPVVGAVIGGAVAGPIGIIAGLKIGALAGVVGGAAGFTGGHFIKKRQNKITDIELDNLSRKRCSSEPSMPSEKESFLAGLFSSKNS